MTTPARARGDRGFVGGAEVLPFAVLTFVVGSLMVANAWAVVDAKMAVTSGAREATRVYVEAPDQPTAATRARVVARDVIDGHGRHGDRLRLQIDHADGRAWGRCTRVIVTASYPVPAVSLPWIGGFGRSFDAVATHSELIDPYRAGLPGTASC
jgi:hypothetical protein